MLAQTGSEFAFQVYWCSHLPDAFERPFERRHQPASQFWSRVPERLVDIRHLLQDVAGIEVPCRQRMSFDMLNGHRNQESKTYSLADKQAEILESESTERCSNKTPDL